MPESKRRKKKNARPVTPVATAGPGRRQATPSPPWFPYLLLGLFLIGIAWLLTYYFSNGGVLGMQHLGGWNLAVGFGFIVVGLGLSTQWR